MAQTTTKSQEAINETRASTPLKEAFRPDSEHISFDKFGRVIIAGKIIGETKDNYVQQNDLIGCGCGIVNIACHKT